MMPLDIRMRHRCPACPADPSYAVENDSRFRVTGGDLAFGTRIFLPGRLHDATALFLRLSIDHRSRDSGSDGAAANTEAESAPLLVYARESQEARTGSVVLFRNNLTAKAIE